VNIRLKAEEGKFARYQNLLQEKNDSIRCGKLIDYASEITDSLADYNFAIMIFEKVVTLLKDKNYPTLQLALDHKWAYTAYKKGDYDVADKLYVKALASTFLATDKKLRATILVKAGANLLNLTVYKRAMVYYDEALELYAELKDEKGKGMTYLNMANIFVSIGSLKQADDFFERAERIFLKENLYEKYLVVIGNKASVKWQQGKFEEAKILWIRSLDFGFKKIKNAEHNIINCFNVGLVYTELKRWDSCFYYLNRGKHISDSLNLSEQFDGTYYYDMGYCYVKKGETKKAISFYKRALKIRTNIPAVRSLYDNLSNLYFDIRQFDTALIYKNKSAELSDSIYKSELKEHILFENKRLELLEKDYKNQVKAAEQEQYLGSLKRRNYLLIALVIILVALVLLFFLYFKQYKLKVKKEQLQSELDFLKAQLNPHFLFNSINNIYILLDQNKEEASEILVKFSDLMRYQLYECNVNSILLNKELYFLENYLAFEMLRYSNKIKVVHNFEAILSNQYYIAPLLLQPFIENAFKHTPKSKNSQGSIEIYMTLKGNYFTLEVTNTHDENEISTLPGGIGLENVRKRLDLLYSGKHELLVRKTEGFYKIALKLELTHD
jgi:tetratricopeptide (TPR) repeat protein